MAQAPAEILRVVSAYCNPNYDPEGYEYDVCLLTLVRYTCYLW